MRAPTHKTAQTAWSEVLRTDPNNTSAFIDDPAHQSRCSGSMYTATGTWWTHAYDTSLVAPPNQTPDKPTRPISQTNGMQFRQGTFQNVFCFHQAAFETQELKCSVIRHSHIIVKHASGHLANTCQCFNLSPFVWMSLRMRVPKERHNPRTS